MGGAAMERANLVRVRVGAVRVATVAATILAVATSCGGGSSSKQSTVPMNASTTTLPIGASQALRSLFVPTPAGYAVSKIDTGPETAREFYKEHSEFRVCNAGLVGTQCPTFASQVQFVRGFRMFYDSKTVDGDYVEITIHELASTGDADRMRQSLDASVTEGCGSLHQTCVLNPLDPPLSNAAEFDLPKPEADGTYDHSVLATKGAFAMVIDDWTHSPASRPQLAQLAHA